MKAKSINKLLIGFMIAFFFAVPLTAAAIIYTGVQRENRFSPTTANIQIEEGNTKGDKLKNEYTFRFENGAYRIEKPVAVYNESMKNDENLRVRFVPMWYDADGYICVSADFTDYRSIELNDTGTALLYCNAAEKSLLTLYLDPDWETSWEYKNDGCFYYKGLLKENSTTPLLLSSVEISEDVYKDSEGCTLRLDVIADAVQQYGEAADNRNRKQE